MLNTISNFVPAIFWTLTSGVVLTIGDIMLRSWFETKWNFGFELTFLVYVLGILCMMMSFFQQNIAVATVAAVIINAIGYLCLAYFLYGDMIGLWQIVGIVLGLAAFTILEVL